MRTDIDPFTQVLAGLWDMLMTKTPVADLVKPGNRIHLAGGAKDPHKDRHSTSDLPNMYIYPSGGVLKIPMTSSSYACEQGFSIRFDSGDKRTDRAFFPLKWYIFRVLCQKEAILKSLGLDFVKNILVADYSDSIDTDNKVGWSMEFTVTMQLVFSKTETAYYFE